ncbi:DNA transposition protein [Laribacter hongkongensis]|uniref:Mor transcription activator family protein n=1 Tax=Laribacter hongkongensis TaxID=168471 RepID=UPI001EFC3DC0|nr:Mor transcription activator family protein [Laribacter hongkongensis]MCG8993238.1 DNA transposition protein [Laribacter hongkongensis]MCG8997943.1 DNA transposition protein [Laribacter hongkongensis]MCG9002346.1 DNA transposition protein [Laribacter hongkongensis]MCG9005656.1 DNA transposition protein [Laribacter hongkongensis]MCG9008793.1 DNA transposition protein [Laribacter hongkongensis]
MKLESVQHLLPEMAKLIAELIGLPKALKLIEAWGGTTFPVSKNKRREGQIRYEALAEVVGVDAANILTCHFGGEVLSIPRCAVAMREIRDRMIRAEFDQATCDMPAVHAVNQLARRYQMTERNVWMVLKKADALGETRQEALF